MKKIILGAILLFSMTLFSQTVYNGPNPLTNNDNLGQSCGNAANETITFNGVLDLSYNTLTLKNVRLEITGSIINLGEIKNCGNGNGSSELIINGVSYTLPYNSGSLSSPTFDFAKDYGYGYKAYDITGKVLAEGVTSFDTFFRLPKKQILILKVDTFKELKIYVE